MKGLLIKDLKLLKSQKLFITVVAVICCYLIFTGKVQFGMTYAAIIFSMLVISTVNYDDDNNGMGYLLTFPVSRKKYVLEKYVLGILFTAVVLAAGIMIMAVSLAVNSITYDSHEWFSAVFGFLLLSAILLSVTLPIQIKYGAEKGRMVLVTVFICIGIALYGMQKIFKELHTDLTAAAEPFLHAGVMKSAVFLIALWAGMIGVSYLVSVSAMKRKQF